MEGKVAQAGGSAASGVRAGTQGRKLETLSLCLEQCQHYQDGDAKGAEDVLVSAAFGASSAATAAGPIVLGSESLEA